MCSKMTINIPCDLDFPGTSLGQVREKPSVMSSIVKFGLSMLKVCSGRETCSKMNINVSNDLHLGDINTGQVRDTPLCHDSQLCQVLRI